MANAMSVSGGGEGNGEYEQITPPVSSPEEHGENVETLKSTITDLTQKLQAVCDENAQMKMANEFLKQQLVIYSKQPFVPLNNFGAPALPPPGQDLAKAINALHESIKKVSIECVQHTQDNADKVQILSQRFSVLERVADQGAIRDLEQKRRIDFLETKQHDTDAAVANQYNVINNSKVEQLVELFRYLPKPEYLENHSALQVNDTMMSPAFVNTTSPPSQHPQFPFAPSTLQQQPHPQQLPPNPNMRAPASCVTRKRKAIAAPALAQQPQRAPMISMQPAARIETPEMRFPVGPAVNASYAPPPMPFGMMPNSHAAPYWSQAQIKPPQ